MLNLESGKKSSSSTTLRRPHFIDDPNCRSIDDPKILIDDPYTFIDDPHIFIDDPHIFIDDPHIFIDDPHIFIDEIWGS